MKKNLLFIIFFLLVYFQAFTQVNCKAFYHIGTVNAMQNVNNQIWLATADNGLAKFDKSSETFEYYDTSNTILASNHIQSILEWNDTLYISTDSQLYYYHDNQLALINDTINGLLEMMPQIGLAVVDAEMVYFLQNHQIVQQKDLNTILSARGDCCVNNTETTIDDAGHLWISRYAFYEYDVLRFDGLSWMSFHSLNTAVLPIESFTFNGMDNRGDSILVTNWNGIQLYDQGNWSNIYDFSTPFIQGTDTIFEPLGAIHYSERMWLGTDGRDNQRAGRLIYQQGNNWYFGPVMDSLPSIITEIEVNDSRVYVGTSTGFGWLDTDCFSVGVSNALPKTLDIKAFPNPTQGQFTLTYDEGDFYEMYHVNGQLVQQGDLNKGNQTLLTIHHLPKGVYIVRVKAGSVYSVVSILRL